MPARLSGVGARDDNVDRAGDGACEFDLPFELRSSSPPSVRDLLFGRLVLTTRFDLSLSSLSWMSSVTADTP